MADQLRIRSVTKTLGGARVLQGVDLDVPRAGVLALVGPSGCGKTTLVRLVAGFDRPDEGTIEIAGALVCGDAGQVPAERRRVGVVPQEGALFTHLDVRGNIGFGLARRGRTSEGRARVAHMLELVGLAGLGSRRPHQLSGGQQQRVAVARALAPGPDLVCLDEPFSALDANLRTTVREAVMAALRAERASVLLVTHDQDEALSVADIVAVLLDGRIAQVGSPEHVYARPSTSAVARFLGEAMLLPGRAAGDTVECELGRLELSSWAAGALTVLLRPEQLVAEPFTDGGRLGGPRQSDGAAGPPAEVLAVAFHGHDALVSMRTHKGTALQARMLSGWLPRPGEPVRVRVRGPAWPLPA